MDIAESHTQPKAAFAASVAARLALLTGLALGIRVAWLLWHGAGEITWDGAEYARVAQNIASGHGLIGIRGATNYVFPPLYSLLIALLLPLTGDAARAGLAVSLLSGAALVIPMYALGTAAFGRRTGWAAAAIAVAFPFAVELSTVVLADALFLTLVATGLAFLVRTTTSQRLGDAALCACAFGLAYLTRPEALLFEAFAIAVVAITGLRAVRSPRTVMVVLAAALPFAVLAAPYAAFLSEHAGHVRVEGKSILNLDIGLRMDRGMSYAVAADAIDDRLNEVGPELHDDYYFEPRDRSAPALRTIAAFGLRNSLRHVNEIAHVAASRVCGTIAFMLLALIGLIAGLRSRATLQNQLILVAYGAVVFLSLASVYHFWERYFVGFVPLFVIWAALGLTVVTRALDSWRSARAWRYVPIAAAAVLAVCCFSIRSGFTDDASTTLERDAGAWLAAHAPAGALVLSISDQSVYYGGDVWKLLPYAPDANAALRYVRKVRPDFVVLDRDYASERPYVAAWLATGIPDGAATTVTTFGNAADPQLTIVRWAPGGNRS